MDDWNARQVAYVMTNMAWMHAAMADIEALKAELIAMQANDRNTGTPYTEQAYLDVAKKIEYQAGVIRALANQMGGNAAAMT